MSGSGPTVFALFTDRAKARKAAALVKRGVCPEGLLGNKKLSGTKRAERRT